MLTDTTVRQARPRAKPYKKADSGGLYLYVTPRGGKIWRFDFRHVGRRQTLTLGPYPQIALKAAREAHATARRQLANGQNPAVAKQVEKRAKQDSSDNTFKAVAEEWFDELKPHRSASWASLIGGILKNHLYPRLQARPIDSIDAGDILGIVRKVANDGTPRAAEYARWVSSRVFSHAIRNLKMKHNPAREIRGAIALPPTKHRATLKPRDLPAFLRKIDAYQGRPETQLALQVFIRTFVRPIELVSAEWSEFDLEAAQWRIAGNRMKKRREHIVPLSRQLVRSLRQLHKLTGQNRHAFPNLRDVHRPMSDEALRVAFVQMGYAGVFTPHGIRGTASTILNEQGFKPDVIERQLAHVERSRTRAAYNHAEYLPERVKMMQSWSNFLDALKAGENVVHFPRRRTEK